MMSSTVNIVEIIDGKYNLNVEVLSSLISLAEDCDKIALISIIGSSYSGKSFLINFLLNYLESDDRNSWPQRYSNNYNHGFKKDFMNPNPVIQMCSKPLILEEENQKIAIFLMDSSRVFTDVFNISRTKLMEDIIGLFMFTSSTVICIKKFQLTSKYLKELKECLVKNLDFIKSVDSFQELFFYIQDWDSKFARRDHSFGLKGGKDYINNESEGLEFQKLLSSIECYLMPPPGTLLYKESLDFSFLSNQFILQLSQMVKMKLLNIDEIQIKTKPKTDQPIKANELIELFESYINTLNADSNNDISNDLVNSIGNLEIGKNSRTTTVNILYKENSVTKRNLEERRTYLTDSHLNTTHHKTSQEFPRKADDFKSEQTVSGDNETKHESRATYAFAVQSNTSINTSHSQINTTENDERELTQNRSEIKMNNKALEDVEMTDVSTDTIELEILDTVMSEFDRHLNREESISLDNKKVEETPENITQSKEIKEVKMSNSCQDLLNKYRICLEKALKDSNFDFENEHENEKKKSLSNFKKDFKKEIHSELYKKYIKELLDEMYIIKNEIKKAIDEQISKLRTEYELKMNVLIESYDEEMRTSLESNLKLNTLTLYLTKIHNHSIQISVQSFEKQVKEINDFNKNLLEVFSNKLKHELNLRKKKYEKAFDLIKSFRNDWDQKYKIYRYISLNRLHEIQNDLCEKIGVSLDKLNDEELKQIIVNSLKNIFDSIKERNEDINDQEIALTEEVVNFVFNLFCKRLNYKLKSGLFSSNDVKQMHQKLLEHTLQTMITDCDFREYQKHLTEKCESNLKNKVQQHYRIMTSQYLTTSEEAKRVVQRARKEAINKYCSEMERTLSEKSYFKRNEFKTISSRLSNDALKMNEELLECLKNNFNQNFYRFLVSENNININKEIIINEEKFAKHNDKNAPNVSSIAIYFGRHNLSAANYDKEIRFILDKNGHNLRPNSIAFSDEILFGYEAKAHNDNFQSDQESFNKNFDIKQLIAKYRKSLSKEELISYPFEFLTDKLSVKVDNDYIKHDFSIESLIALQVLDIKLDAEKQLGNTVTSAVLTVPTHYNLRQRSAFRDVAKIAGLEEVIILSEISAAAISYANDINRVDSQSMSTVFFVVINELDCDAAICSIKDRDIEYKSYFYQNLVSDIENTSRYKGVKGSISYFYNSLLNNNEKPPNDKILKAIKSLYDRNIRSATIKYFDNIVIAGSSILMDIVIKYTAEYFGSNLFYCCDPIDIITTGSTILSQAIARNEFRRINISEVSLCPYYYTLSSNCFPDDKKSLLERNELLPCSLIANLYPPQSYHFPLKISIFQEQTLVSLYTTTTLPTSNFLSQWFYHNLNFKIDEFGEIKVVSKLTTIDSKREHELNLIEIKLGLTKEEIIEEHNIIASIELRIKDKLKLAEENSAIVQAKDDLESYYLEVKKSVESNSSLRGLKLKKINKELEITSNLLKLNNSDVKSFLHQKIQLEQIFVIL